MLIFDKRTISGGLFELSAGGIWILKKKTKNSRLISYTCIKKYCWSRKNLARCSQRYLIAKTHFRFSISRFYLITITFNFHQTSTWTPSNIKDIHSDITISQRLIVIRSVKSAVIYESNHISNDISRFCRHADSSVLLGRYAERRGIKRHHVDAPLRMARIWYVLCDLNGKRGWRNTLSCYIWPMMRDGFCLLH